jgi:fatty-acyl-CoA synthase
MTPSRACLTARNDNAALERFPAKWELVRRQEARQDKGLERRSDSIGSNSATETTVGEALIEWARQTPFRTAYVDGGRRGGQPRAWTFEALRDDAAMLAVALLSRYEPGERIALWAPPCAEAVLLQFAAALAGLVLVRIDPAWRAFGMARVMEVSEAAGLFVLADTHGGQLSRAAEHAPPALRETVDLADRWALFAKHRCVDGLPEVVPQDPAEIRYPAPRSGASCAEIILHRDLADALRKEWADGPPRIGREAAVA